MKKNLKKYYILLIVVIVLVLFFYSTSNLMSKQWQEFILNREFICPEKLTKEESEAYLSKFTSFYFDNYPDITFDDFLSKRMQQLVTHKCVVTLQNIANVNNGGLPNQDSVKELKNIPHGVNNKTLKEMTEQGAKP